MYVGQTVSEMVGILEHVYNTANSRHEFEKTVRNSTDNRLNTIGGFEAQVFYALIHKYLNKHSDG